MLVPIQTSGTNPPLYFIHGLTGVMPMGGFFARSLGPEQPIYSINVSGIDGRGPMPSSVKDMVIGYVEAISKAQPHGPLLVGGMCAGALAAIEVVREFQAIGRETGPVILVDPPTMPLAHVRQTYAAGDPRDPLVAAQLYRRVRCQLLQAASEPDLEVPFAVSDEKQVDLATWAGVNCLIAFSNFLPEFFSGAAIAIVSSERAAGFFHPQMYWAKLLPRGRTAHVLPFDHPALFRAGRHDLVRVLRFALEDAMNVRIPRESTVRSAFMPA
jgi:pimeloyl-ACP methyl ester carboxylesterase